MDTVPSDRTWMYDRNNPQIGGIKQSFINGVEDFVAHCIQRRNYETDGRVIRCPCVKCDLTKLLTPEVLKLHLYRHRFKPDYYNGTHHGEIEQQFFTGFTNDINMVASSSGEAWDTENQFILIHHMTCDALGIHPSSERHESPYEEEAPNVEAQNFYEFLAQANTPLYDGATDSTLSMCVRLMACKSNWHVPDACLDAFSKMILDATPVKDGLPKSYYEAKKLVGKLGLKAQRIDCCENGCMIYYDTESGNRYSLLTECRFCGANRYKEGNSGTSNAKPVPVKAMFYLPIIPMLQRMFASMETAPHMI